MNQWQKALGVLGINSFPVTNVGGTKESNRDHMEINMGGV